VAGTTRTVGDSTGAPAAVARAWKVPKRSSPMSTHRVPSLIGATVTRCPPRRSTSPSGSHDDGSGSTVIMTAWASSTSSVEPSPVGTAARPVEDAVSVRAWAAMTALSTR
jgi:hypothetical protein